MGSIISHTPSTDGPELPAGHAPPQDTSGPAPHHTSDDSDLRSTVLGRAVLQYEEAIQEYHTRSAHFCYAHSQLKRENQHLKDTKDIANAAEMRDRFRTRIDQLSLQNSALACEAHRLRIDNAQTRESLLAEQRAHSEIKKSCREHLQLRPDKAEMASLYALSEDLFEQNQRLQARLDQLRALDEVIDAEAVREENEHLEAEVERLRSAGAGGGVAERVAWELWRLERRKRREAGGEDERVLCSLIRSAHSEAERSGRLLSPSVIDAEMRVELKAASRDCRPPDTTGITERCPSVHRYEMREWVRGG